MRIKVTSKKIRERFLIIYELRRCRKAVDLLIKHYGVRPMIIIPHGRKVGKRYVACHFQDRGHFTKRGLTKRTRLHELYHHLVYINGLNITKTRKERVANGYARGFLS